MLLPRAPRRFALRHRDGTTRLATLSYLTADPAHRAVAYGLSLPDPVSPARLGLVYALARVLEAFDTGTSVVGHGDLSTKNVLWSLQRGPEVFVIDCDNCEHFGPDGRPLTPAGRRRAMTPNWDDPAVAAGHNPTLASDRYSLALIFLRVVGAANFPIQARQRQGGPITVDFAVPSRHCRDALLGPGARLWDLCERGLSVSDPACRPPASAWLAPLEAILDALGAAPLMRAVWAAQGGGAPSAPVELAPLSSPRDVIIRPVPARPRPPPRRTLAHAPALAPPWRRAQPAGAVGGVGPAAGIGAAFGPTGSGPAGVAAAGPASVGGGPGGSGAGWSVPGGSGARFSAGPGRAPLRSARHRPGPGLSGPGRGLVGGLAPAHVAGPVDVGPSGRGGPPAGGLRHRRPGRGCGRPVHRRHDRFARARDLMVPGSRPVA